MISSDGAVLCETCIRGQRDPRYKTMARLKGTNIVVWAKHHGETHEQTISLDEILPEPGSDEFTQLVADLLRKMANQITVESHERLTAEALGY